MANLFHRKTKPPPPSEPGFRITIEFDPSKAPKDKPPVAITITKLSETPVEINAQTVLNVLTNARDEFLYQVNRLRFANENKPNPS